MNHSLWKEDFYLTIKLFLIQTIINLKRKEKYLFSVLKKNLFL
jgi:hypothetical protein